MAPVLDTLRRHPPFNGLCIALVFVIYGILHSAIRLLAGPHLAMDDPKENVLAQRLQLGYLPDNPPLYEWLLWSVQTVTGYGPSAFLLIKYTLFTLTGVCTYFSARNLKMNKVWAALTAYGLVLLYQFGWNYHQAFTHSLVLITGVSAFFWAYLRFSRQPDFGRVLILGITIGICLLAKYNTAIVIGSALCVGYLQTDIRRVTGLWLPIIALLIGSSLFLPHGLYMADKWPILNQETMHGDNVVALLFIKTVLANMRDSIIAMISFFFPFILIVGILMRRQLLAPALIMPQHRFLKQCCLLSIVVIFLGILFFGVGKLEERHVIPFLFPAYLYIMKKMSACERNTSYRYKFANSILFCGICIFITRTFLMTFPGPPICSRCSQFIPYKELQMELRDPTYANAILVGFETDTAGNLRAGLPKNIIRSYNLPFFNPVTTIGLPCFLVWSPEMARGNLGTSLNHIMENKDIVHVQAKWNSILKKNEWRETNWFIAPIPKTSNAYKYMCTPKG